MLGHQNDGLRENQWWSEVVVVVVSWQEAVVL